MFTKAFLLLLCAAASTTQAWATIATLGPSSQNFGLTGVGPNAAGQGQSRISWGTCAFDGTNTNCTVSGTFTGFDGGGTYSFVITYPGTGTFPLLAITNPGSDFFSALSTGPFSLVITLNTATAGTIHFYSFANFSFLYNSSAVCTGVTPCSVNQVGQTPNATMTGPITGTFDPTPLIQPNGVVTASAYGAFQAATSSTWIEIYGYNLATTLTQTWGASDFVGAQAPAALGGTTVTVAGKPAYVYYVSPGQVDVQVPSGVPTGSQPLVLTTAGGSSLPYPVQINAVEPGFLAPTSFIIKGNQNIVALFAGTLTYVLPVAVPGVVTARAKVGDNLTLYGVGFGSVSPTIPAGQIVQQLNNLSTNLQINFAGVPATITYQGLAPGFVGLYQFNVVVPKVAASDTVPVTFTLGGAPGPQNLVIAIQ